MRTVACPRSPRKQTSTGTVLMLPRAPIRSFAFASRVGWIADKTAVHTVRANDRFQRIATRGIRKEGGEQSFAARLSDNSYAGQK